MAATQEWFDDDKFEACAETPLTRRERFSRWMHGHIPAFIVTNLLLILLLFFLWGRVVVVVPAGYCGTLFSSFTGTVTSKVYREGLHIISPFSKMTTYEMRMQLVSNEYKFLTYRGLEMTMQLDTRFMLDFDELPLLHQEIGPDYIKRVLIPEISQILHQEVSQFTAEQIVKNKEEILKRVVASASMALDDHHILIDNITLSHMEVPPAIKTAIEEKLAMEQVAGSYIFRQDIAEKESKRLQTEALGIRERNTILANSLNDRLLRRDQIEATRDLAKSPNAKVVIMGSGADGKAPLIVKP
jgi:regulator of protease activity HflC (stomatin/prohibitin superfamily)